ncbi:RAMP superfamily CRISPR-associated protein [Gynuella sunshinyii]|uniref:Uncharacterized protein predicted to be involved in DNA repair (RAMP superfamily) n=1 Tax=Gynuella sunshinyii YC6258 TaxID=1445510 RepID=A0A0C5VSD5_9GAMM|nr:RAMP superfamily CRISPR-associated protein [Gynuella sunshinyii]AJQ93184.1 uncharacterized protein predicted to be involved in DNA repair (RAMP superfamily) [Gynuella sunshinyii YC6258]
MPPKEIICHFKLVTPCFISTDSKNCADTIPPTAIKGALMFWWRALNWHRVYQDANNNTNKALQKLHQEEREIWGGAGSDDTQSTVGQSRVMLRVEGKFTKKTKNQTGWKEGMTYLAGQGLKSREEYLETTDSAFKLKVRLVRLSPKYQEQVEKAILVFGLLGGLGSRSRKGFGSVALQEIEGAQYITLPTNYDALKDFLKGTDELPPFTAFSNKSRVKLLDKRDKCSEIEALESVAEKIQEYRRGEAFKGDAQLAATIIRRLGKKKNIRLNQNERPERIFEMPYRVQFGLPHGYFFREFDGKGNGKLTLEPFLSNNRKIQINRRSSPLIIHMHQFPDDPAFYPVMALLPAVFLPPNCAIAPKGKAHLIQIPAKVHQDMKYEAIHTLLDQMKGKEIP